MQDSVAAEYRKVTGKAINITDESARESFASGAYGSRWAVDQATGVEISWPVLPVDAIREAAYADVAGEDFEERYRNYQQTDKIKVQQHIAQGIAAGESYQKAARKLRDDITVSLSKAMQITRTESTRDYTLGRLHTTDELGEIGIEARKQWVATLDARTRDSHGSLDGELADEDGEWSIHGMTTAGPGLFGDPAEDINCRCSYIDVIAGFEPEFRRIRDEEIVPYVKYTDWAEAKGWTADKGWPKAKEAKE
jgi:SPP1 gp7 family putative phage head morphogenesis protein